MLRKITSQKDQISNNPVFISNEEQETINQMMNTYLINLIALIAQEEAKKIQKANLQCVKETALLISKIRLSENALALDIGLKKNSSIFIKIILNELSSLPKEKKDCAYKKVCLTGESIFILTKKFSKIISLLNKNHLTRAKAYNEMEDHLINAISSVNASIKMLENANIIKKNKINQKKAIDNLYELETVIRKYIAQKNIINTDFKKRTTQEKNKFWKLYKLRQAEIIG